MKSLPASKESGPRTVHEEREAYFAGRITAHEYLSRALPAQENDHVLNEQFRRILIRLTRKEP